MKMVKSAGKEIYIVQSHNQVLEAWEKSPGLNVFTLDFHTDTKRAFSNYSFWRADSEFKAGRCSNTDKRVQELCEEKISDYLKKKLSIKQINDNLKHDEHLDFAVSTELVDMVFVLATSRNSTSSNPNVYIINNDSSFGNQKILQYSPLCVPECTRTIHDSHCNRLRADSSIENSFLEDAVAEAKKYNAAFFDNYILDIDCDYFNTDRSLYPGKIDVFKSLIKESRFITIALEPECVKICRQKGHGVSSDIIVERLLSIIGET